MKPRIFLSKYGLYIPSLERICTHKNVQGKTLYVHLDGAGVVGNERYTEEEIVKMPDVVSMRGDRITEAIRKEIVNGLPELPMDGLY